MKRSAESGERAKLIGGFVAFVVWALFRLKPMNNFTVAACDVVGRWALAYVVSLLPLEMLSA